MSLCSVGVEELQQMMMDLSVYGSTNQDFCLSQTLAVGAACCARSSGRKRTTIPPHPYRVVNVNELGAFCLQYGKHLTAHLNDT